MLDIGSPELLLVAIVAIIVIGPKDLPKAMRLFGYWVGRARGVMRQFRSGFDAMVREAELQEMEKRWAEENKRIMEAHSPSEPDKALPPPEAQPVKASTEPQPPAPAPAAEHQAVDSDRPVMTEKPHIVDQPELPMAPAPQDRAS
ncbi:MAG: Sec-independent protein translocase protein TatB [Sphingomonas sp.]